MIKLDHLGFMLSCNSISLFCFVECEDLRVVRGVITNVSEDARFVTVACEYGSVETSIVKECINGTWTDNQCQIDGK